LYTEIHLLKEKKQIDEARRVCETIMTQYRESRLAPDAAYQLRLLKPSSPPVAPPTQAVVPPPPATAPSAPPAAQSAAPAAPPAPAPKNSAPPKKP
jgi:hypothetical protein